MVSYIIICTVSLLVSTLTLFSGFGLGTLLLPAFSLFFPIQVAVGANEVGGGYVLENGRGKRIRTSDLSVPNRALYQAEPCPEGSL